MSSMQPPSTSFTQTLSQARGKPIVLVGASVRAAAESACRGGLEVVAVDCFGDEDTRLASQRWISATRPSRDDIAFINDCLLSERRVMKVGGLLAAHPLVVRLLRSPLRLGGGVQTLLHPIALSPHQIGGPPSRKVAGCM